MGYKDLESTAKNILESIPTYAIETSKDFLKKFAREKTRSVLEVLNNSEFIVEKNRVIVVACKKSYTIYGFYYCSCSDFYMKNFVYRRDEFCKHLLAFMCYIATNAR